MNQIRKMIGSIVIVGALVSNLMAANISDLRGMKIPDQNTEKTSDEALAVQCKNGEGLSIYKVGLRSQDLDLQIQELKEGTIQDGELMVELRNEGTNVKGVTFEIARGSEKETTSNLDTEDITVVGDNEKNHIVMKVKKEDTSLSTISLNDIELTVNRTVPEGRYDLVLYGSALKREYIIENIIGIGSPNTGGPSEVDTFTLGSNIKRETFWSGYTETIMDAAPYRGEQGEFMVPMKYIFDETARFTLQGSRVTIQQGERSIAFRVGTKNICVDGQTYKMSTIVENKNGRLYMNIEDIQYLDSWEIIKSQDGVSINLYSGLC